MRARVAHIGSRPGVRGDLRCFCADLNTFPEYRIGEGRPLEQNPLMNYATAGPIHGFGLNPGLGADGRK